VTARRFRHVAVLVGVVLFLSGLSLARPAQAAPTGVRVWAPAILHSKSTFTKKQAISIARRFDVVFAHWWSFQRWNRAMRTANPQLQLFAYVNGMLVPPSQAGRWPRSWYSYDREGRKIRSSDSNNVLMNPISRGWRDHVGDLCAQRIERGHYDGCYIDVLGSSPIDLDYLSAIPVHPRTKRLWTVSGWMNSTSEIARIVERRLDPQPLYVNGLRTGQRYFDNVAPTRLLLYKGRERRADGGVAEAWLRMARVPVTEFRPEKAWVRDLKMLRDAKGHGSRAFVAVKLWARATEAQRLAWHQYSLASFLLADPGNASYFFMPSVNANPWALDRMARKAQVGTPRGTFFKEGGVYKRKFTDGLVLVNPSSTSRRVNLAARHRDLSGNSVSRRLTMAPHSGKILLK
jgi:hypothetical protein